MAKNGIHFELDDNEYKIFKANVLTSGFKSQTDFIKSRILSNSESFETEADQQHKELLLKLIEQNDMIQKILLSSPNNENTGIVKLIKKLLKQEFVTYALIVRIAMRSENNEEIYEYIDKTKAKAEEVFGKDE